MCYLLFFDCMLFIRLMQCCVCLEKSISNLEHIESSPTNILYLLLPVTLLIW